MGISCAGVAKSRKLLDRCGIYADEDDGMKLDRPHETDYLGDWQYADKWKSVAHLKCHHAVCFAYFD